MFRDFPDILTVAQAAQALGVCQKVVYKLVNNKILGAIRLGRIIKIPKFSLEEYVKTARNNVVL